jgi:hypothetical protein
MKKQKERSDDNLQVSPAKAIETICSMQGIEVGAVDLLYDLLPAGEDGLRDAVSALAHLPLQIQIRILSQIRNYGGVRYMLSSDGKKWRRKQ